MRAFRLHLLADPTRDVEVEPRQPSVWGHLAQRWAIAFDCDTDLFLGESGMGQHSKDQCGKRDTHGGSAVAPVAKLERGLAQGPGHRAPADASLNLARMQLHSLSDASTTDALHMATTMLREARQVWIMGFGLSAHLAAILALELQP